MHLASPDTGHLWSSAIVGTQIPMAVGTAFANKQLSKGRATAVFFGDGAVDEGAFWESLNLAALMRLPLLFVCEDNGLAVHTTPEERHGYKSIDDIVARFHCDAYADDSNDVESIYRMTRVAAKKAMEVGRPAFLRIRCMRYLEHVGVAEDWNAGYRHREEAQAWFDRDSVLVQRERARLAVGDAALKAMEVDVEDRILDAVARADAAPHPTRDRLARGVFYEAD
jgi:TPP-dependent pyruvate/acetoin dehydrogenase alpha subunit